jgi:hypothetical protein
LGCEVVGNGFSADHSSKWRRQPVIGRIRAGAKHLGGATRSIRLQDPSDEAITSTGHRGYVTIAGLAVPENPTQGREMNPDACFFDNGVRPNPGNQLFFADQLARTFNLRIRI